jgi:ABC-type Fe3+-citrate transport system substrate-binding protein
MVQHVEENGVLKNFKSVEARSQPSLSSSSQLK